MFRSLQILTKMGRKTVVSCGLECQCYKTAWSNAGREMGMEDYFTYRNCREKKMKRSDAVPLSVNIKNQEAHST